jgi:hypothetical protein
MMAAKPGSGCDINGKPTIDPIDRAALSGLREWIDRVDREFQRSQQSPNTPVRKAD